MLDGVRRKVVAKKRKRKEEAEAVVLIRRGVGGMEKLNESGRRNSQ